MNQRKAGVILSYLSILANSIVMLIYIPMLLHFLTKGQYGIYQLMGSIVAYLSIMDFGLAGTTTRYLSQAMAIGDTKKSNDIISTSYTLYLIIACIILVIGTIFYFCISPVYSNTLTVEELVLAKKIFVVMLFNFTIIIPANIFIAVINSYERFIFIKSINLIKVVFQPFVVWAILSYEASALNVVLVQSFFIVTVVIINYLYCRYKLKIRFYINLKHKQLVKSLTKFSFFIFLHSIMDQVYWRVGHLILGAVSGSLAVANYAIAMQVAIFTNTLPVTVGSVFLPKISAIIASNKDLTEIDKIFCKLGRLQFNIVLLFFLGFVLLGKVFFILWIGNDGGYEVCYFVSLLIIFGYIVDVTQSVGNSILQALNKHPFRAYVYVVMAILNILLSIVLAKKYGEIGCAFSTMFCLLLGPGVIINWYYNKIGLNIKFFWKNLINIFGSAIVSFIVAILLWKIYPLTNTWISFLAHGIIFVSIYSCFSWMLALNSYEKDLIRIPLNNLYIKMLNIKKID